jgi:hypothetical protein
MALVAPMPMTATRTVSLGSADLDGSWLPMTMRGNPSDTPAAIEVLRKFLRVKLFIELFKAFTPPEFRRIQSSSHRDCSNVALPR